MSVPRDRRASRGQPRRLRVVRLPAPRPPLDDSGSVEAQTPVRGATEVDAPEAARTASVDVGASDPTKPEAAAETKPAPAGSAGAARRWRPLTVALVVALVAALAAVGVTGQRWYEQYQLTSARQAALASAKQFAVDFVSISASSVDRDLQRISSGATGAFADEFTRGVPQVRAAVVENGVESRGTVLRAGLVSGDVDSAVVLVAVDATVKNRGAPEGRLSHYRAQLDLARDAKSDRWLVSRLQFLVG